MRHQSSYWVKGLFFILFAAGLFIGCSTQSEEHIVRDSIEQVTDVGTPEETVKLLPLNEGAKVAVGDEVEVHLSLTAKHPMEYVHLRDPRPAGFEPVSFTSSHKWDLGIYWYEEVRDSGTNFFLEKIPQGNYPFKYRLRAAVAGTFKAAPATVQPMYAPEFTAYSSGRTIDILSSGE